MECIGFIQFAQAGSASQFHDASSVEGVLRTQGAIMHSRIRIVGGICFGVVAVMCTAIPLLLARDRSRPFSAATLAAIARVEAEIDRIEADAPGRVRSVPDNQVQQIELLGKLMLFDKELSVNRNEACAFCHTPETGFTGPVSELNRTTGSYPGSVRTRFSERKPQTHTYAPLAPRRWYVRPNGAIDRQLRSVPRSHCIFIEVRCRAHRQSTVYAAGKTGLRRLSREGQV